MNQISGFDISSFDVNPNASRPKTAGNNKSDVLGQDTTGGL
jgi:hypothetical protein